VKESVTTVGTIKTSQVKKWPHGTGLTVPGVCAVGGNDRKKKKTGEQMKFLGSWRCSTVSRATYGGEARSVPKKKWVKKRDHNLGRKSRDIKYSGIP